MTRDELFIIVAGITDDNDDRAEIMNAVDAYAKQEHNRGWEECDAGWEYCNEEW